jgi:hypothetical protein
MKTLIAAFALGTLAAGPVFAQSYIPPQPDPTFTVERPIGNVWGHWLTRTESCHLERKSHHGVRFLTARAECLSYSPIGSRG